jgi:hypothetical protein
VVTTLSALAPWLFTGVSFVAGVFNLIFIARARRNNQALLQTRANDVVLRRISRGFIYTWLFIVFNDSVRVVVGTGLLLGNPHTALLLLLSPFASLLVAVIGLRSFR